MEQNIIYLRTSTEDQHPEIQLDDCKILAKQLNLNDCEVIEDKISGWKDIKREGFDRIIQTIKKKETKHLICWDLDRLYRNRKRLVNLFEISKIFGCTVHSVRQGWLEDINKMPEPFNDIMHSLMLQIMGWIAEEESTKKSERVKLSKKDINGVTYSKYGKKWGRKEISTQAKNKILELRKQGLTIKQIREQVKCDEKNVSIGVIHKIINS